MIQTPKLYAITYERFPEPGGEGYLDTELRIFTSKREAKRYGQETVAEDNNDYETTPFVIFKDVRLVRKIDGYRIQLISSKTHARRQKPS